MIKWVVILVCAWALFKLFTNDNKKKTENKQATMEKDVAAGDMVKDPICGSFVSKDQQIRVRDGETVHYFCSYDCRDTFLKQLEEGSAQIAEKSSFPTSTQGEE